MYGQNLCHFAVARFMAMCGNAVDTASRATWSLLCRGLPISASAQARSSLCLKTPAQYWPIRRQSWRQLTNRRPAPNTFDHRSQPVSGSVNSWEVLWPIRGEDRIVSANGRTVFVIMWYGWKQTGMVLRVTTLVIAELSSRWHSHSSTMTCYYW